ncbi:uncharacterized protein PV09_08610 [Verruconis gallopava]|uniref:Uncharacterized protein n=1 Tax=Verruconis gallopava TaxID=253628 RepID=A0A0D1YG90_9PEZI|nr:uncharacterized protein PV09_08610 [Verruconis gallopava]KIV99806.1 hypothetical protein PV09_08610 [Verruconis gallopava]
MPSAAPVPPPQHRNPQTNPTTEINVAAAGTTASGKSPPQSAQQPQKEWTEDDYVLALAFLEQVQDVVSSLRTALPQIAHVMRRKHERPRDLYLDFSKQTMGGARKLADLKKMWEGRRMSEVRAKVESSVKEHGRGVDGVGEEFKDGVRQALAQMPRFGWLEEGERLRKEKGVDQEERAESSNAAGGDEAVESVVESFRKRHDGAVTVAFDRESKVVAVDLAPSDDGMPLHFDVLPSAGNGDKIAYQVSGPRIPDVATKGEQKLFQAIQRCVALRPKQNSLDHTLSILAAYRDLTTPCSACQKLVDGEMLLPAARQLVDGKRVKAEIGSETSSWVALHESCLKAGS